MSPKFVTFEVSQLPMNWLNAAAFLNMYGMFNGATAFNQPIGDWNTSKVTDFGDMFTDATAWNARYPGRDRP